MLRRQRAIEFVPSSKPLRGRRYDVPQHRAPETSDALRFCAVEGDLDLLDRRHRSTIEAGSSVVSTGPPLARLWPGGRRTAAGLGVDRGAYGRWPGVPRPWGAVGGVSGSMPSMLKRAARSSTHSGGVRWSASGIPVSRAKRRAAGRDQANLTTNRSPTTVLDDHHNGSAWAAGSGMGTATGYPLSSGATIRSASPRASAEHSASHLIPVTPATSRQ